MATLNISDEAFQHLTRRAAAMNTTVEALTARALDMEPRTKSLPPKLPDEMSYAEWKKHFDDLLALARSFADRYPPGFEADVSRKSMYEGCGQ